VSALNASASLYGVSGLIQTPDDSIASAKSLTPMYARVSDLKPMDTKNGFDLTTYGAAFGILPNLEVSIAGIDPEPSGWSTEAFVNAKYRLLSESVDKPSVTVGVVDIAGAIDDFTSGAIDDPSMFIVIGKNITNVAEGVSGEVSKPVRGTLGFGTGLYKGLFAGLDIAVAPKCSLALEYTATGMRNEDTVSGGIKFQPIQALTIEAGAIGFESFYAGASYNLSTF
jgi:hypothetical protein